MNYCHTKYHIIFSLSLSLSLSKKIVASSRKDVVYEMAKNSTDVNAPLINGKNGIKKWH
jgi:hypothetical protein